MMASTLLEKSGLPQHLASVLPSPIGPHPLDDILTERRRQLFRQVLARRCSSLCVVVEDCHDPHNATAVIRSCDAMGVHRIHVCTPRSAYRINRKVSQGAHRYMDLRVHAAAEDCYAELRADGFRIVASDLRATAVQGPQHLAQYMQGGQRLALVFGSEGQGLSKQASDAADGHFLLPMAGFSESLNLSVSVAMSLQALRGPAMAKGGAGDMSAAEQNYWYDRWLREQHPAVAARRQAEDAYTPLADPLPLLEPVADIGRRGEELDCYDA